MSVFVTFVAMYSHMFDSTRIYSFRAEGFEEEVTMEAKNQTESLRTSSRRGEAAPSDLAVAGEESPGVADDQLTNRRPRGRPT